jgi:predicted DNA-binding protein
MSKYTAFRCPEELLDKAKAKAQRDRRSLSNYLITLIERDVGAEPSEFSAGSKARSVAPAKRSQNARSR